VPGPKLNEYPAARAGQKRAPITAPHPPSARAQARYVRMSPYKVRQVLDLIRGHDVERAVELLRFCERDAARVVGKLLGSAVANAAQNHEMHDSEELYVSACYADEGPTLKRWRPRARGRATRIRKRTCHITVIVSRLPEEQLQRQRSDSAAAAARARRIAGQRAAAERGRLRRRRAEAGTPEQVEGADLGESAGAVRAAVEAAESEALAEHGPSEPREGRTDESMLAPDESEGPAEVDAAEEEGTPREAAGAPPGGPEAKEEEE
jgi:large subunit ribosomal protein L22